MLSVFSELRLMEIMSAETQRVNINREVDIGSIRNVFGKIIFRFRLFSSSDERAARRKSWAGVDNLVFVGGSNRKRVGMIIFNMK